MTPNPPPRRQQSLHSLRAHEPGLESFGDREGTAAWRELPKFPCRIKIMDTIDPGVPTDAAAIPAHRSAPVRPDLIRKEV